MWMNYFFFLYQGLVCVFFYSDFISSRTLLIVAGGESMFFGKIVNGNFFLHLQRNGQPVCMAKIDFF